EMLFGRGEIADRQIGLAHVLMCCAVARIEVQRLSKMRERWLQLTQAAIAVSDIVLDLCIARIAQGGRFQHHDGALPIAGRHRLLARREIRIELCPICTLRERFRGAADRPLVGRSKLSSWGPDDRIERHSRNERPKHCTWYDYGGHGGSPQLARN